MLSYPLRHDWVLGSFAILLMGTYSEGLAQSFISGHILDSSSKEVLRGVIVQNRNRGILTISDEKGYFNLSANAGDRIVFTRLGYRADSLKTPPALRKEITILLNPLHVELRGVSITGKRGDYQSDSAERYQDFAYALKQQEARMVSFPELHPLQQMQNSILPTDPPSFENIEIPILSLNLDAVYQHLSKKQKRLWKFQKAFYTSEQQEYIHSRVTEEVVSNMTGLYGDSLTHFIGLYHPDYQFVRQATDYELFEDIRKRVTAYRKTGE